MKTRVLIIEPSPIVAGGLVAMLAEQTRFKVLTPLASLTDLEQHLVAGRPDVIVVNIDLVDTPARARGDLAVPVVGLVYHYAPQSRLKHYDALIDITDSQGTVVDTLIRVVREHQSDAAPAANYELSPRETDVLVEVARGRTNKEIADALHVSVHTVISHRKNIMHKTGIKSVAGLTVYAILNNLIDESVVI